MTNQVNEVLEKIREVCDLKRLEFGCEVELHTDNNLPYGNGAGFMYCMGVFLKETSDAYVIQYEDWQGSYPKEIGLVPRASRITKIIGLPVQLNHLLWALGETEGLYMLSSGGVLHKKITGGFEQIAEFKLQKSVEDNLRSNPELTKWVHGVIIGKE